MPNLECIALCGQNVSTFMDFVNEDPALRNPSHSLGTMEAHRLVPTHFPALSEIRWTDSDRRDRVELIQCLVDVLRKRLYSACPITRLKLKDNSLSRAEATGILEAAPGLKARFEGYLLGDDLEHSFK
jgi:hypothetical protein